MNNTHFHLLLNHFPVIGTLIGSGLLLWGIIKKQDQLKFAAAIIFIVMAVVAIPVYLTGEPAEESVEKLPGVSEAMIEMHESAANIAIWLMGITGIVSLAGLLFAAKKNPLANTVYITAFILSAICFAAMARTGYYGGQIRHTEIRSNSAGINTEKQTGQEEQGKDKDDD